MNYKLHYDKLINRGKNRIIEGYTESHHIIPKCMNGEDNKDNLVNLTAREHFIAHILLVKIYPKEYGLIKAVNMMCTHNSKERINNKMYGWLKEKFSKEQSRSQSNQGNSQYGKIWIYNVSLEKNLKITKNLLEKYINKGWVRGRVTDFSKKYIKCKGCETVYFNHKNSSIYCSDDCKKNTILRRENNKEYCLERSNNKRLEALKTYRNGRTPPMKGKKHSKETKEKISRTKKESFK